MATLCFFVRECEKLERPHWRCHEFGGVWVFGCQGTRLLCVRKLVSTAQWDYPECEDWREEETVWFVSQTHGPGHVTGEERSMSCIRQDQI